MRVSRHGVRSLVELLQDRAARQPDERAYTFLESGEREAASLTWQELERRSRAIAVAIAGAVPPRARVLIMCPPGLDFVPAFFGCLYAGAIAVPTYPPAGGRADRLASRLCGMVHDAAVSLVLGPASAAARAALEDTVPELRGIPFLDPSSLADDDAGGWRDPEARKSDVAFLQYTSGSTAAPRGVMVTHANLLHNLGCSARLAQHDADSVSVSWLPVNHDMGLIEGVLQPAYSGFPAYLMAPAAFLQRPVRWLQCISRLRATHSGAPNFAYDLCVRRVAADERSALDLSSWRTAFNGSEPVRRSTLESFQQTFGECGFRWSTFRPAYGLAEATLLVSSLCAGDDLTFSAAASPDERSLVTAGVPPDDIRVLIVDPATRVRCEDGTAGEIWISGPSVAAGYWGREQDTCETFGACLQTGEGPFLRTGDLGFVADGQLFVSGRLKDVLIVRGVKHHPHDLELTAEHAHASIRAGCCAAFARHADDESIVMAAELEPRATAPLAAIVDAVRRTIADVHRIQLAAVALLPAGTLPKTTSGKLQRYLCRNGLLTGTLQPLAYWTESREPAAKRAVS
jgi:acyl-CoA synthetase (AMP-forming)/AMP-acid ligase II